MLIETKGPAICLCQYVAFWEKAQQKEVVSQQTTYVFLFSWCYRELTWSMDFIMYDYCSTYRGK
jgi:hypothetical protein